MVGGGYKRACEVYFEQRTKNIAKNFKGLPDLAEAVLSHKKDHTISSKV
jgi:hypothetical protein